MDAIWGALIVAAASGVLAVMGKRVESGTSRAVEAQGAAAKSWQDLAEHHEQRADKLDEDLAEERAAHALNVAALQAQVRGLEGRLADAGLPIRSRARPLDEPARVREPEPT